MQKNVDGQLLQADMVGPEDWYIFQLDRYFRELGAEMALLQSHSSVSYRAR